MPINHTQNVEHIVPKNPMPGQPAGDPLAWENMLLACVACNGPDAKGNKPYNPNDYYTPVHHNTLLAFSVEIHPNEPDAAIVVPHLNLSPAQKAKAEETIDLFKWQAIDRRPKVVDLRWKKRREAIEAVKAATWLYDKSKVDNAIIAAEKVAVYAKSVGFFMLWFTAFAGEPTVIEKLLDNNIIPGTAQNCFDRTNGFCPIPRNPGSIADPI
ncbi:MAG: hypothetical protein KA138_15100 [Saprospiraceae bacterium]|nr:hypothetical protein [Saprospiraceae bacterium]